MFTECHHPIQCDGHMGNAFPTTPPNEVITTGKTTTLTLVNPQPSDAGHYDCVFSGLNLQRIISLG